MYDGASRCDAQAALQRARGELRVAFKRRGDATVLDDLRQQGCLKARFPRTEPGGWTTAVTLNTSGGVVGGDRLDLDVTVQPGAKATIVAQAAERFYRAMPGSAPALVDTAIGVAAGGALEWLPQETILYDRCALRRRLVVDLAADGWFLGVETLVFGRVAMGETVDTMRLNDLIQLRRAGTLLLHDAVRLDGEAATVLNRPAAAGGARAVATLVHVAPDAEARLDALRAAFSAQSGIECGVSAWNGMLIARILSPESASLRRALVGALPILRGARPLPRVWMC